MQIPSGKSFSSDPVWMACEARLLSRIASRGWKARIVSASHLSDLEAAIDGVKAPLDEAFHRSQLSGFSFDPPPDLPCVRSLIIVAVPVPQIRIFVRWRNQRLAVVVPPTYAGYSATTTTVQDVMADCVGEDGYRIARPFLPLKTLAVRSGLAEYGRNNLCYVPGMGSFLQLVGGVSDMPCPEDSWREAKALERCDTCVGCQQRCPTAAVGSDRFLLHTERCLTYHNESAAAFPAWVDPSWHHCLVGCMRCQTICPENKAVLEWFDDRAEFSAEETTLLLGDRPFDALPAGVTRKMRDLQLNEAPEILRRNLRALLGSALPRA